MKVKAAQASENDRSAVFYADDLVITVSHGHQGYELLVEVDTDDSAAGTPVEIGNAIGDSVEWTL